MSNVIEKSYMYRHLTIPYFTGVKLQVCRFLEVSKLSFSPEYGPKLKEDYIMVKHLPKIQRHDDSRKCCSCQWFGCCKDNWQKVALLFGSYWLQDGYTYLFSLRAVNLSVNLLLAKRT